MLSVCGLEYCVFTLFLIFELIEDYSVKMGRFLHVLEAKILQHILEQSVFACTDYFVNGEQ